MRARKRTYFPALLGLGLSFAAPAALAAPDGRALYAAQCETCHQADGVGAPYMTPPLQGAAVVAGDAQMLARWVLMGNQAADAGSDSAYDNMMPGFDFLSDAEIAALLNYVRAAFGPPGLPRVTPPDVAAARQ